MRHGFYHVFLTAIWSKMTPNPIISLANATEIPWLELIQNPCHVWAWRANKTWINDMEFGVDTDQTAVDLWHGISMRIHVLFFTGHPQVYLNGKSKKVEESSKCLKTHVESLSVSILLGLDFKRHHHFIFHMTRSPCISYFPHFLDVSFSSSLPNSWEKRRDLNGNIKISE